MELTGYIDPSDRELLSADAYRRVAYLYASTPGCSRDVMQLAHSAEEAVLDALAGRTNSRDAANTTRDIVSILAKRR